MSSVILPRPPSRYANRVDGYRCRNEGMSRPMVTVTSGGTGRLWSLPAKQHVPRARPCPTMTVAGGWSSRPLQMHIRLSGEDEEFRRIVCGPGWVEG